ncbi:MAG: glycoside hydrolase family 9 protein [Solirubrobacterales bacterium]
MARIALAFAAAGLLALPGAALAKGVPTVIRTGGPSAPADAKVAIVASDRNLGGERFEVEGPGEAVGGKLRPAKGFSGPWKHAYTADISAIGEPGSYRVAAAGARSKPWLVLTEGARPALQTMLDYFATNRDGTEPALLHGPAHLNDAVLPDGRRIALQGGWMDAGDMIHFTQTTAFAATALQLAALLDPADAAALNSEADVGIRWLVAAHPEPGLFIAQLGDARDHDEGFRDPASDDAASKPGIGQRVAYPGTGGDVAGKAAAALALAAMRAPAGAGRTALTQQAREWYAAGEAAAAPLRGLPEVAGDFYFTDSFEDDLAAGAAMLFRLTGEEVFLADAVDYLRGSPSRIGFGVYDLGSLAAADLCGGLGSPPVADSAARDFGCATLGEAASDARTIARQTAFANPGPFSWGTTAETGSYGTAAALAGRTGVAADGLAVAAGGRDYLLGRNPWGASFVTGFGPKAPREPHHWASVFGDGLPNGAVVGGPAPLDQLTEQGFGKGRSAFAKFSTSKSSYEDRRANYVNSEPAIDYTAASILLIAAVNGQP